MDARHERPFFGPLLDPYRLGLMPYSLLGDEFSILSQIKI